MTEDEFSEMFINAVGLCSTILRPGEGWEEHRAKKYEELKPLLKQLFPGRKEKSPVQLKTGVGNEVN